MKTQEIERKASLIIVAEILFSIMPLLILMFITILNNQPLLEIFKRSDISFISVYFFGQTLVRFISGIAKSEKKKKWQVISLFVSLLFIFGIIPSIILLIVIYTELYSTTLVYILQNIWLIISILAYFIFGKIGQMYLDE